MPQGYSPAVFVSSTYYDLSQIRTDLKQFLESLGLDPILSEFTSFPINPDASTIQNCIETVKNRADIMLLIIGNRYGFQTNEGKSITNLEYLQAKAKGVPIYVFVLKSIINTLPIWEKNQQGDFSNVVDNTNLFVFVNSLRNSKEHWVFPFESAEDIIHTLRQQLSYLFMESLSLRQKSLENGLINKLQDLKGNALKIAIERPTSWEYLLFSQVLYDQINDNKDIRYDLKYNIYSGRHEQVQNPVDVMSWLSLRINELTDVATNLNTLFI